MADPKLQQTATLPTVPREVQTSPNTSLRNPRLPVMPFAVLLPRAGDLTRLPGQLAALERRIAELQSDAGRYSGEEEAEQRRRRGAEESMLNQILQWLSMGSDEGEQR